MPEQNPNQPQQPDPWLMDFYATLDKAAKGQVPPGMAPPAPQEQVAPQEGGAISDFFQGMFSPVESMAPGEDFGMAKAAGALTGAVPVGAATYALGRIPWNIGANLLGKGKATLPPLRQMVGKMAGLAKQAPAAPAQAAAPAVQAAASAPKVTIAAAKAGMAPKKAASVAKAAKPPKPAPQPPQAPAPSAATLAQKMASQKAKAPVKAAKPAPKKTAAVIDSEFATRGAARDIKAATPPAPKPNGGPAAKPTEAAKPVVKLSEKLAEQAKPASKPIAKPVNVEKVRRLSEAENEAINDVLVKAKLNDKEFADVFQWVQTKPEFRTRILDPKLTAIAKQAEAKLGTKAASAPKTATPKAPKVEEPEPTHKRTYL